MKVHALPWRSYIDPETEEKEWIQIPVVRCETARKAGWKYTLRLLPDFLIPGSPIRLDRVLEAERKIREEGATLEDCCLVLGCIEPRTVKKHLHRLNEAVRTAVLHLSEMRVHSLQFGKLPETDFGKSITEHFLFLYETEKQAYSAAGKSAHLPSHKNIIQAELRKIFRKPSTSYELSSSGPP